MAPRTVLVMRHAEKTGDPEDQSLAEAGAARVARRADFIPDTFGVPGFLFASAITRHSARPYDIASVEKDGRPDRCDDRG
jgi:hypothetical protein